MNNYFFEVEKGDFIFTDPETGKDWSNHLWNDRGYLLAITHFGGTFSRYIDENNVQVNLNKPSENYLFVRDEKTKAYWNITLYPALNGGKNYRCVHGQGYSSVESETAKIKGKISYAVAKDDTWEVWEVTLENADSRPRSLSLFAFTKFDLDGFAQPVYYSAVTTSETLFSERANAVYCRIRNPYAPHGRCCGYISSSEPVFAYDGNTERFIGTFGTPTKPLILERGENCSNSLATVRTRGGILQNKIVLQAGDKKTVYFVLGLCGGKDELEEGFDTRMRQAEARVSEARAEGIVKYGTLRTVCPDPRVNGIMNFWAEKQVCYSAIGKKAVRDNAQLAMGMLNFDANAARRMIEECVAHQYADGHAVLTWYPYLEPNVYSDTSAWLILSACEYVKESGDFDWLNKRIAYLDGGEDGILDHLKRAAQWYLKEENLGPMGLPRIRHADWNDALNIPDENAESVFTAMLVCLTLEELSALLRFCGENNGADELLSQKERLHKTVNEVAFNGSYYVRALSKYGVVGDRQAENGGAIYLNPQAFSVLAGIVTEDRLESVLSSIDEMETEEGIPLCAPPYQAYDDTVGRMSGMLPGVYENGGIYNHAACFKVMADCKLKRRAHAFRTLSKIIPDGERNPSDITTTEPYVFTNCYLKHPSVDMQVGFSWQTGTSAWGLRCYYEGILGIKRSYGGLEIDPCLPPEWNKAEAYRVWRGNKLHIVFLNNGGDGVTLSIDEKAIEGNTIPAFLDEDPHEIIVCVGEPLKS